VGTGSGLNGPGSCLMTGIGINSGESLGSVTREVSSVRQICWQAVDGGL
jgi:hypothetical protein